MPEPTDSERVSTLPKWAQKYIGRLEAGANVSKQEILRLSQPETITDTDTVVYSYRVRPDINLEKGATVRFTDKAGDVFHCQVRDGELLVSSADGPDGGDFVVLPLSGSRVRVLICRQ